MNKTYRDKILIAIILMLTICYFVMNYYKDYVIAVNFHSDRPLLLAASAQLFTLFGFVTWQAIGYVISNLYLFFTMLLSPYTFRKINYIYSFGCGLVIAFVAYPMTPSMIVEMIITG
jgi:hypothetical protein